MNAIADIAPRNEPGFNDQFAVVSKTSEAEMGFTINDPVVPLH